MCQDGSLKCWRETTVMGSGPTTQLEHAGAANADCFQNSFHVMMKMKISWSVNPAEGALACYSSPRSSPVDIQAPRPRPHLHFSQPEWNHHPPSRPPLHHY